MFHYEKPSLKILRYFHIRKLLLLHNFPKSTFPKEKMQADYIKVSFPFCKHFTWDVLFRPQQFRCNTVKFPFGMHQANFVLMPTHETGESSGSKADPFQSRCWYSERLTKLSGREALDRCHRPELKPCFSHFIFLRPRANLPGSKMSPSLKCLQFSVLATLWFSISVFCFCG